ncbi:MAG TPA: diguanylate cyclase [Bacilli bacterium]
MSEERMIMNLVLDLYSLMVLLVVFFSTKQNLERSNSGKIYYQMLIVVLVILVADALSTFDGNKYSFFPVFNQLGSFLIFLLGPIIPGLWILYVGNELMMKPFSLEFSKKVLTIIFIINLALLIGNQFWGWYYCIDASNIYHRGPLFVYFVLFNLVMIIYPILLLMRNKRALPKHRIRALIFFALVPIVGIAIQTIFYGYSVSVNFLVFSLLIAFIFIQKENLDKDFLTHIGNRRKLDQSFNAFVHTNRSFSAILLDLDNFKQINDKYGHQKGDWALMKTVEILKSSLREGDILTRYGGDEFCILTAIDNHERLKEYVRRIRKNLEIYNESPEADIPLDLSIGYMVFQPGKGSISEFIKKLDQKMYKDKSEKKRVD